MTLENTCYRLQNNLKIMIVNENKVDEMRQVLDSLDTELYVYE